MDNSHLQKELFGVIKDRASAPGSLADEIAVVLDISADSAYRRIRGEKSLSLDELARLCGHYKISLDQLMQNQPDTIVFQGQYLEDKGFRFENYMTSVIRNLTFINNHKQKEFYYICKDLPIFHHFVFREIAAFKWFFWLKTYFDFPGFEKRKFRFTDYPDELFEMDQQALALYNQIPSTEIWNIESMNILFRQIEFYRDGGVFESDQDVLKLYEAIEKLWTHLEKQAALGYKFNYNDAAQTPMAEYKMYFNEVLLGDNNMFIILDGTKISYITHSTINFMITRDLRFNENMYRHIRNQMKRSSLISSVSEKERARFFRIVREKINFRKQSLAV